MDCLFHSSEKEALDNYIHELHACGYRDLVIYAGLGWDISPCLWTSAMNYTTGTTDIHGYYHGIHVLPFAGLEDDTCCVLPKMPTF